MAQAVYDREFDSISGAVSRVRWSTVFAGLVVGLVCQALLTLLGLAIGFNAFDPGDANYSGLGIGSGLWMLVSALISTYAGGWVASSLANVPYRYDGMIHGILTWGMLMIVTLYLLGTGLGMIAGGAFNLMSSAVTGASQGVAISATDNNQGVAAVRQQVDKMGNQMNQPQTPVEEGQSAVRQEQAADTAARVAWFAFFTSLLSLLAGAFGGISGFRNQRHRMRNADII